MASSANTISRYGLSQVHQPQGGAQVDVVFVHGLNGDPHNTWTSEKPKVFWPAQLLPSILEEEKARILVYGFDADVTTFIDGASRDRIHNHAEHLVAELAANRRIRKATERPIVFVAHSLGGLVVKRALIYSSEIRGNYTEHLRSIFVSTYGILFLGTPHRGSDLAKWGSHLEAICHALLPKKAIDSNDALVNALKSNNETLQNIDRQFVQLINRFHVYFFHEGKPTDLKGTRQFIVDEDSASPTIQDVERAVIQADHSHMCKFVSENAPGFDLVAEGIQRYAGQAPGPIATRWNAERAERIAKKTAEVEEIMPGSMKKSPNTESSSTTPASGTTPGKEQLALPASENVSFPYDIEEVNEPAEKVTETRFSGAIADFWPYVDTSQILPPQSSPMMTDNATNTTASPNKPSESYFIVPPGFRPNTFFVGLQKEYTELDKRLFSRRRYEGTACVLLWGQPGGGKSHLARQYVNNNHKRFPGGIFWISAKSIDEMRHAFWNIRQKVISRDSPELCEGVNGNDFVQLVKAWFEARREWLIIFDGVNVDRDEDATKLTEFIPDSKDSSIIYISRAKSLETKQRLLRPFPIKVGPLKEEEAKKLLFKELRIRKPTEAENKKATELVKKVGGLPLAINAISRRLADTHEPLTKYKLSTSADPTIEGTYNTILDDLQRLGHMEAWNLINILCWFAQDLPFEMVHLGLKILRAEGVEVRSKEGTGRRDIDNTVAILMRHALLERNEPDNKESASSSRDSLNEPEPIDMLKMHSVVQNFCCDSLNARRLLPQYLTHAVKLFSYSYHQADVRIKLKPEPGRVSDYRYYETHGKWLWNHASHYDTKTQSLDAIRDLLAPTLERISEEIRLREPGSSQESLHNGIFQASIFDRTSSSSDSGPIGPLTPNHRPTPPPLANENDFGFPVGKAIGSPASFGTASPGLRPKILGNSPRFPNYEDIGYESDRSEGHRETPMQRDFSRTTARPPTPPRRPRAPTTESHDGEWQVVRNSRKQPRGRRDLGSFRPTPSRAQVNRQTATGSIHRAAGQKENRRDSSPALKSLANVQSRSPPQSQAEVASLFRRGASTQPPTIAPTEPTWAGVAAGRVGQPTKIAYNAPLSGRLDNSDSSMLVDHGRSPPTSKMRPGSSSGAGPSPLASVLLPSISKIEAPRAAPAFPSQPKEYPPLGYQNTTPYPDSRSGLVEYPETRPNTNDSQSYSYPHLLGANPAPLPYEDNVSLTTKRPLPLEFRSDQHPSALSSPQSQQASPPARTTPYQQPSPPTRTSPYQQSYSPPYPSPTMPSGYTSQPISRNQSHLSSASIAETDPNPNLHPPIFSRQHLPTTPISSSPRDRHHDGRPFRKSPKTEFATPAPFSSRTSPNHDISHAGGWADSSLTQQHYDGGNMLGSSSGPGVAIDGSLVQFGEHQPLSIEDARRRTVEYEQRLKEREEREEMEALREVGEERERRGRREEVHVGMGSEAPYPDVNLIPTNSDARALKGMVDGGERRQRVGLGFELG